MFKKWRESRRKIEKLEQTLMHIIDLFEQVNARQYALLQYLVANGTFTSDVAISVADVRNEEDVQRLLREAIQKAQAELGENLNVKDV